MLILTFTTANLLHVYYVNIVLQNVKKNRDIVITKPDKGNAVVILDRKVYNNGIEEIISETSKFEKLNKGLTLKREASL